jgi:hypothetical protein
MFALLACAFKDGIIAQRASRPALLDPTRYGVDALLCVTHQQSLLCKDLFVTGQQIASSRS